jgi:uncharacterized protein YyaL (SSP411 family)
MHIAKGTARRSQQQKLVEMVELGLFWDAKLGGDFTTSGKDPSIILRTREAYDSGEPSPNSLATLNLLRLRKFFACINDEPTGVPLE